MEEHKITIFKDECDVCECICCWICGSPELDQYYRGKYYCNECFEEVKDNE